jgi:subtilisin family serine protease
MPAPPDGRGRRPGAAPARRAVGGSALALAAAATAFAAPAAGAVLTPALQRQIALTPPAQALAVVVTLSRQVDPGAFQGRPTALIQAARRLADRTQPAVIAAAGTPARRFWITNALALSAPAAAIRRIAALRSVAGVDLDRAVSAGDEGGTVLSTPARLLPIGAAPTTQAEPGGEIGHPAPLDAIGVRAVWSGFGITGAGVTVGSIDTGVDPSSPDLAGKIVAWRDFVDGRTEPYDDNGHGTHTIGTMVGGDANGTPIGVAPGAKVIVARAMGADGSGLGSNLLAAAQWVVDPDGNPATLDFPAVVNNSWTADEANDTWYSQVIRTWVALGIVPVFSAGNFGPGAGTIGSPAGYPLSIAVGAVDDTPVVASFSSRGPVTWRNTDGAGPAAGTVLSKPDLTAPGVGIVSSVGAGYLTYSGTSMAAPHVSGVVALIRQATPAMSAPDVEQILRATSTDLGPPGPDPDAGAGLVNALAAVATALGRAAPAAVTQPPPATPVPVAAPRPVPALRDVRVARRTAGGRRTLLVSGRLTRPARLRAILSPGRPAGARGAARAIVASRAARTGPFALTLQLVEAAAGRQRLSLSATDGAGRSLGPPVTRAVQVLR